MIKEISPASRLDDVKEYWFSRKLKEIARLNAAGADIISLGIGGPDLPPAPEVIETLVTEARKPDTHGYQMTIGLPELRDAYSRWYERRYGVTLDPSNEILPLIGSKEGVLHISMAMLNPGDCALVPDPGYPTYQSATRLAGGHVVTYPLTEKGGWQPDFDALERLPELGQVKLMWLNYPHMPTGTPATREILQRAVDFGRRHGIMIVNDNPYSHILHSPQTSILQIPGAMDVAMELNSLSKSHNMAGWRMAMLAGKKEFISWVLKVKSNVDSGQFRPMMLAAVKALEAPQSWYDSVNAVYASRRKVAEEIMRTLGCRFDPAQAGLFLWGRIPDWAESGEAFANAVLDRARVFITPGFIFGHCGDRYVRISLCAPENKLQQALQRISSLDFSITESH